ncbi:F-box/kelch-repeat protein [Pyrus ussuriensis x Pyrus communis]|uniref:F-box/kelch-repeat protein n=1 Tax=Pyrus ussuriensis x Pyrus communis TaxID=2448454 RepID=A0A5N5FY61_9ROSA|nr:F-box/kelch-repeat protein [Pyrus ussuriensis x Pyrus communis]
MFNHTIPEEILFDILATLPVKSLLRFRCVCKSWKFLISSSIFKNAHLKKNVAENSCEYLLIQTDKKNCLSLFDAETLSKCLDIELHANKLGFRFFVHGSCNGLVCISGCNFFSLNSPIYLWNPSIRKIKRLPNGCIRQIINFVNLGFGFHSGENDYKVVRLVGASLP